jgi:dihydroneopterin aldolase
MKSRYAVNGMSFHAFHGVLEVERELGQVFSVDATLDFDMAPGEDGPRTEPLVKDADVYEITRNVITETKYRSTSILAGRIAHNLLDNFTKVNNVTVAITRRQIFIPGNVDNVRSEVSYSREDFVKGKAGFAK